MKKEKRRIPRVVAAALVLSVIMVTISGIVSASEVQIFRSKPAGESIHEKIDISEITGEVPEPPQLTSAASSVAKEKEWYEYIYYSSIPVGRYNVSDTTRVSFYDPYNYADALVMKVDDTLTDWSSSNSLQVSYTTGSSMTDTSGKSTETSTSLEVAQGDDVSESESEDSQVVTKVEGRIYNYNYGNSGDTTQSQQKLSKEQLWDPTTFNEGTVTIQVEANASLTDLGVSTTETTSFKWNGDTVTKQGTVADYEGEKWNTHDRGYTEDKSTTTATTSGGDTTVRTTIANRFASACGSSSSSSISLSTDNSTTITKTYDAGYFNSSGAPLQWKIIQYTVIMPMKYQIEYLVDGEWVFGDYSYCLLTTVQGTCRAWMQNNVAYYEHWGTGEPVTWNEFWSQFFTEESLIAAYESKLYPDY